MLGHAIRGELAELAAAIRAGGSERRRQVLGLLLVTAPYIAVDVSGRWPTDADLRKIARAVAEHENSTPLTEVEVHEYVSGAALGFRPPAGALGDDTAAAVGPALITGGMLFIFRPRAASGGITSTRSRGPTKRPRPRTCRCCLRSRCAPACWKKSNLPAESRANSPCRRRKRVKAALQAQRAGL
jgi:hypothetical protein